MRKKLLFVFVLLILTIAFTGIVNADDTYSFDLTEADHVEEHTDNWYVDVSVPQISGMADKDLENDFNAYFLAWRDYVVEGYKQDSEQFLADFDSDDMPHFGYEYNWKTVTDSADYLVFNTWLFYAAGSSMTENEYWTLNKHTGKLAELDEFADSVRLEEIHDMILAAMIKENEKQEVFWTDEDNFDAEFALIQMKNHWFVSDKGNLVITFDKYDIAPGAYGEIQFEIDGDKAILTKDEKYSFDLHVGDTVNINENNWFLNIYTPVISGLADPDEENKLNLHFNEMAESIKKEFETAVATAEESIEEGNTPHFGYEYSFEILADTDNYFSFKTIWFFAAGSSMTSNEFWTLDKNTGKLVQWEEVVPPNSIEKIHAQIFAEMTAENEAGEGLYYTDDEALNFALLNVPNYHHWYLNADEDLVIAFDKYEVAVGAQGTPEFVIDRSAF